MLALNGGALLDFAKGVYAGGTLDQLCSCTRNSVATDLLYSSPSGFAYTTFQADQLVVSPGLGAMGWEARTQLHPNPTAPGAVDTVTLASTGQYVIWLNGPGKITVAAATAVITGAGDVVNGQYLLINCTAIGTITLTKTGVVNAAQVEKGATPTSFIPTAALARPVDTINFRGIAAAIAGAAAGTIVIDVSATPATASFADIFYCAGTVIGKNTSNGSCFIGDNLGANTVTFNLGSGSLAKARICKTWDLAGSWAAANGGAAVTGTKQYVRSPTGVGFISRNTAWNGLCSRIQLLPVKLPSATQASAMSALDATPAQGVALGDSLTQGGQTNVTTPWPAVLAAKFTPPRNIINAGVGGYTSAQIRALFDTMPQYYGVPFYIFAGANDLAAPQGVLDNVDYIVQKLIGLGNAHYLVLGTLNNAYEELAHQAGPDTIAAAFLARYGANFVDTKAVLAAGYSAGNVVDVRNIAQGVPPYTLRNADRSPIFTGSVGASDTVIATAGNVPAGYVLNPGTEYIYVKASSGVTITDCIRGYAGSTPASYSPGQSMSGKEPVHINDAGHALLGAAVFLAEQALGW
jgi:lysophospholipase L1-like esterase